MQLQNSKIVSVLLRELQNREHPHFCGVVMVEVDTPSTLEKRVPVRVPVLGTAPKVGWLSTTKSTKYITGITTVRIYYLYWDTHISHVLSFDLSSSSSTSSSSASSISLSPLDRAQEGTKRIINGTKKRINRFLH